jgi:hypothetical protein
MKVKIDNDELCPYYVIDEDVVDRCEKKVEISEERLKKYNKIFKEFIEMQKELMELWNNAEREAKNE